MSLVLNPEESLSLIQNKNLSGNVGNVDKIVLHLPQGSATVANCSSLICSDYIKPGKSIEIIEVPSHIPSVKPDMSLDLVLKLAGFISITRRNDNTVVAMKPKYAEGSSVEIPSLKSRLMSKSHEKQLESMKAWVFDPNSVDGEDALMEDNGEGLLDDADLKMATTAPAVDDCEMDKNGTRKACKNCTCGRAEGQMIVEDTQTDKSNLPPPADKSACGNCSLGDAFRCSGCPYRGMPAFKEGEQVTLTAMDLTPDI